MPPLQESDIAHYLRAAAGPLSGFSRFKFIYRAKVCPFLELLEMADPKADILDVGCGGGMFLSLLKHFRNPRRCAGVEVSKESLETARRTLDQTFPGESIPLELYDGVSLPPLAKEYNQFFLVDVLHHVPSERQEAFLEHLWDTMPAGSSLVFKDIDASDRFFQVFNRIHDFVFSRQIAKERKAQEVRTLLEKIGFDVSGFKKRRMFVYSHFMLVARKPK